MTDALVARQLTTIYPETTRPVLDNVSFSIPEGSCAALLGHNGSGKSTLLKVALGLLPVTAGSLSLFGLDPKTARRQIAYLAQNPEIDWKFPWTVVDFVATGAWALRGTFGHPQPDDLKAARNALQELQISDVADNRLSDLSGGQRQRMLLARALVQDARLLLLDEPFTAVDRDSRQFLATFFRRLVDEGRTLIVATHAHDLVGPVFSAAVHLEEGRVIDCPLPDGVSPCHH